MTPLDLADRMKYEEIVAHLKNADLNMLGVSTQDSIIEDTCSVTCMKILNYYVTPTSTSLLYFVSCFMFIHKSF